jgi:hypothetical protein
MAIADCAEACAGEKLAKRAAGIYLDGVSRLNVAMGRSWR